MEEQKLRARLIRLYVLTVALVLAALLAVILLLSSREVEQKNKESFATLLTSVTERLQTESIVQHSWLKRMETENSLFIHIEDNGTQLLYNSIDGADRMLLFDTVCRLSRQAGIDVAAVPLYADRQTSDPLRFTLNHAAYFGAVSLIPAGNGYRSLIMAQQIITGNQSWRFGLFAICYLLAVLLLSLTGVRLIDRALQPAVESRIRQTAFIAAASHELRSPLAVIQANAATLTAAPAQIPAAAATIENECARMSRLIGDLLLLASTDAKSWPVTLTMLDMDTVLLNVYEMYRSVCAKQGLDLHLHLPDHPLPLAKGDAQRLAQVLGILLENAIAYGTSPQCSSIEISAYPHRQQVIIEVIDHGPGVADAQKAYVFDRFFRGDRSRKDKQHFGLGLSIAYELIALHKGTITLSDTLGGGCTFRICL
ncbi:MAG: HAMP domain-containing sensor histidine kinase [Clostridia bacterium]